MMKEAMMMKIKKLVKEDVGDDIDKNMDTKKDAY